MNDNSLKDQIRETILHHGQNMTDKQAMEIIIDAVERHDSANHLRLEERSRLVKQIYYGMRTDLDVLHPYLMDENITEIMVNGIDRVFIESNGVVKRVDVSFESTDALEEIIRRITAKVHKDINELNPIVDARLADGSRINAVYKNIALDGPILTVRKFPGQAITMEDLVDWGTISKEASDKLEKLVRCGYNIFISGGTSSGKTTFLNILSNFIPACERVIVIEDSAELQIKKIENLVRLECKNANVQGKGQIAMEQLIKTSLRMRPDRIIVGEVRGREVMDMVQAMNTGHDGSLSTGHGNSVQGMVRRLESMYLQAANFPVSAIRTQIAEALDIFVHLGKVERLGRRVLEISELAGVHDGEVVFNPLFKFDRGTGLVATGNTLTRTQKLMLHGEEWS